MRGPKIGAPLDAQYEAAIEHCVWGDGLGFETVYLGEHHGAEDGYLPAPLIMGSAIASRTENIEINFSALLITMHNPLRLAEDLTILDIISKGRVTLTAGIGYRPHEFDMFGVDFNRRLAIYKETIEILQKAWSGEPFDYNGKTVRVTPSPFQKPGPKIVLGGSTHAAAKRSARMGFEFYPGHPDFYETYKEECKAIGRPEPAPLPQSGPNFLHVSQNPEEDWPKVAPHVLYASNSYAQWATERGVGATTYKPLETLDDLKASSIFKVLTPDECVEYAKSLGSNGQLSFQPLFGGVDPDLAWESLHLFERSVLPKLKEIGLR